LFFFILKSKQKYFYAKSGCLQSVCEYRISNKEFRTDEVKDTDCFTSLFDIPCSTFLLVGTSSWSSPNWCGTFYPDSTEPGASALSRNSPVLLGRNSPLKLIGIWKHHRQFGARQQFTRLSARMMLSQTGNHILNHVRNRFLNVDYFIRAEPV
jgi:hypothetical protein